MTDISTIVNLFKPTDTLGVPLATGQPMALLNALSERKDWQELKIYCGLLSFPYPLLMHPGVFIKSGYFGPIERFLNEQGANIEYLPANFEGIEQFALKQPPRIVATTFSPPDEQGYLSFGTHGAAIYKPFLAACQNKDQIAIGEINSTMPRVYGDPALGDNKIHISQVNYTYEVNSSQLTMPSISTTDPEQKIADHILSLINSQATLQFGIGAIPNLLAEKLAHSNIGDLGVHSELISDGYLKLVEAGKISNRHKPMYQNQSVFTFAFGGQSLYDFLDERQGKNKRQAICLPVSTVNNTSIIAAHPNFISINSGLMLDFSGQVCSEAIGLKQYSGVGGQLSFVQGAYGSHGGKSILCIKSTAMVDGKLVSNILPSLPLGSIVSTPRHYTQYIVTEYGIANLYGIGDEHRAQQLIAIAHPQFRDELTEQFKIQQKTYYKN